MEKIIISEEIDNTKSKVLGELENSIIKYKNNNYSIELDLVNHKLIKDSDENTLYLTFNKDKEVLNKVKIKDLNSEIDINTITYDIEVKDGSFVVIYSLFDGEKITYKLAWKKSK